MKRILLLSALVLLAAAPAEASCHFCLDAVVESCSGLQTGDSGCSDDVGYMAGHYHQHVLETVEGAPNT